MLLQVEMPDGPYLADVGFGNLAPTSALLLREGIEQPTPHEPMRFINVAGEVTLQAKLRDTWEHIYRVIPYPRYDGEYEIVNWYTSTHPDAPYKSNIIAARPGPNRTRITMFNRRLTVRCATGEADRRHLKDEAEVRSVLRREFGLNMTDEEIRACIEVMERKGEKGAPHPFFA
jgi:N-hydroxyarylamine O-acetyltransferase